VSNQQQFARGFSPIASSSRPSRKRTWRRNTPLFGWVQKKDDGEWEWQEDDPNFVEPARSMAATATATIGINEASTGPTPQLPSGQFRPKQSLGQNYLNDPNTVAKIVRTFHKDATRDRQEEDQDKPLTSIIELGPGAGAITDRLVANYGTDVLQCIEIDQRAVEILNDRYPALQIIHEDVLQTNYPELAKKEGKPLVVIGNLPYYITSQILFALADASHTGAVDTATVTMQWEVAQRMVAPTSCKVRRLCCDCTGSTLWQFFVAIRFQLLHSLGCRSGLLSFRFVS
jgi:phospholipid N-methyltransferase